MSTTSVMAAPAGALSSTSALTKQLEHDDGSITPKSNKIRSLSDVPPKPTLSPSPAIRESPEKRTSKYEATDPITPRRPPHIRGLSLQMPLTDKENADGLATSIPRIPLSPKLDPSSIYGSPASVLPRRSRGLDFARACTNLHQSTLAESSPDASPITGRGINIPQRRGLGTHNSIPESPSQSHSLWSSMHGGGANLSSSVSSINMMDSDTDSDASSDDMAMDREMDDPMLNTPAASRINALAAVNSPGMDWLNNNGPTNSQMSLMNFTPHRMSFRRARLRNHKSSHSSSSVSMRSSKPSPGPLSPPLRPNMEGYFGLMKEQARSRRESLSLGTDDLHLSDSDWDADTKMNQPVNATPERGVIRRAVTRRSNLLPKTKGFARIRAALMEESDPLSTESRREAEVIKQVHESDAYESKTDEILGLNTTAEPVQASIETPSTDLSETTTNESKDSDISSEPFSTHAKRHSGGLGFWNNFEHTPPSNSERYRSPPPTLSHLDSNASDDTMTSNGNSYAEGAHNSLLRQLHRSRSRSRSTTPLASIAAAQAVANQNGGPTAGDVASKVNNKRRRDDDFDPASFKRRAVSPGMMNSAQSSPVVPQSPTLNNDKSWGKPPPNKQQNERSNSGGSVSNNTPKRIGLQGMTEASDGFMSMSID